MAGHLAKEERIDVICQFTRDAQIIPIKLRFKDSDGRSSGIQNKSL